jgi:hypothetical protein
LTAIGWQFRMASWPLFGCAFKATINRKFTYIAVNKKLGYVSTLAVLGGQSGNVAARRRTA